MAEDVFNLGDSQASSYLAGKQNNNDGLLRPKLEEGRDGKRELVIRLLPNLQKDGKLGPTAIEKHIHYANFKSNPELQGYFDCLKNANIGKDCSLCKTYWNLKNSNNPVDQDKAKLINRSTKYYAYAYVVEDLQVPENEGKIFIYPFGYKIFQKIKTKAESSRKPVKVEDLIYGANLNLVIQEIGGFYNYDASEFESPEPIEFEGKQLKVGADGSISDKERERVMAFLASREHDLEEFMPVDWTAEQYDKADKIVALLSGTSYTGTSSSAPSNENAKTTLTSSAVFDDDDEDEDEEDETPAPRAKREKAAAPVVDVDEDEEDETPAPKKRKKATVAEDEDDVEESTVKSSRKKAAMFFDDEEED